MRALLLAAGPGTRLRPLTETTPKCLVPVCDKPLLEYWLEMLTEAGVSPVLVNLHSHAGAVRQYLQKCRFAKHVTMVYEERLLGTAGTLLKNQAFFGAGPIMLIHADNLSRFDVRAFMQRHAQRPAGCEMTMMTFRTDDPKSCGIVELDGRGVMQSFHEKVPAPPGDLANAAVYILEPSVLEFLRSLGKEVIDFSTEVLPHYTGRIFTFHNDDYHRDIGTRESYEAAVKEFAAKVRLKKPSISVVVPALNEEGNLSACIDDILGALGDKFEAYEIIIINDGSTDRTGEIADRIARANPNVRVKHHRKNRGLGYAVASGYRSAKKEYVVWYPGDNGMKKASLALLFEKTGEADVVIPYIENTSFRTPLRRFVSRAYIVLLNVLFGFHLRYFNGVNIYRTDRVRTVRAYTHGFASFAEVLIRLIKGGCSFIEVPTQHQARGSGESKALRLRNFIDIAKTFILLTWELNVLHKDPANSAIGRRRQAFLKETRQSGVRS